MLQALQRCHDAICDHSGIWFPFLCLRPPPHQTMSMGRVLAMALSFAFSFTVTTTLFALVFGNISDLKILVFWYARYAASLFVWCTLVTRFFWNRRAAGLNPSN